MAVITRNGMQRLAFVTANELKQIDKQKRYNCAKRARACKEHYKNQGFNIEVSK